MAANDMTTMSGLFKKVYAKKLMNLIPDGTKLLKLIPFATAGERTGEDYNQAVVLGLEHGVTFASTLEDAFALNDAIPGQIKQASVKGNALVLRSAMGYKTAAASMGSERAFEQATKFLVGNMIRSVTKKLEIQMLYGQVGYAVVDSVAGAVVTIKASEWASGIWAGAEKMPIEIRSPNGATSRGDGVVKEVSFENKTVTLVASIPGVLQNDVIWHKGAYDKEFAGLHKIISNTGTIFGINAADYSLFKGNTYTANGPLTFAVAQKAVTKAVEKGLDQEDVLLMVAPDSWADLMEDQAALRQLDQSYSTGKSENGSKEIAFYSQNGKIEVVPSIYVKSGYAYVLCVEDMVRIGSTDVTFVTPGRNEEIFLQLPGHAGYELRLFSDQALFVASPAKNVLITGITPTA